MSIDQLRKSGILKAVEFHKIPWFLTHKDRIELKCLHFVGNKVIYNYGVWYIVTPSTYNWWMRFYKGVVS